MDEQTDQSFDEAIQIVKAVKRHLQEERCTHSIDAIVVEALESKMSGLTRPEQAQPITPRPIRNDSQEYSC